MDTITLKNFRCFREKQTARLAPLTLLVGENSTGKTFQAGRRRTGIGKFHFTFGKRGSTPIPVRRHLALGKNWIDENAAEDAPYSLRVGTARGAWQVQVSEEHGVPFIADRDTIVPSYYFLMSGLHPFWRWSAYFPELPPGFGILISKKTPMILGASTRLPITVGEEAAKLINSKRDSPSRQGAGGPVLASSTLHLARGVPHRSL